MKSRGSDDDEEEEDWDPVVVLASLKNAKLDAKAALELEMAKREVYERCGIGKDKKDKEEATPKNEDNEVSFTARGCDAVVLGSLEKTASELEKMKREFLTGKEDKERASSDSDGRNDERGYLIIICCQCLDVWP